MKNKKMFVKYMTLLAEIHNKDLSEALLGVYWAALQKSGDDTCEAALNDMILNLKHFPKPADMIEAVERVAGNSTPPEKAQFQVSEILQQVRDVGSWGSPVYSDPITKSIMSSRWSWSAVCSMTENEHKWWAKEFIDAYQAIDKLETKTAAIGCGSSPQLRLLAGGIGRG